ncbi:MAG TPA: hypothetical protein VEQ58_18530 [Polyangiaceae bacterium]|nr:hypothetical protein [Polyangiaceae bacterium]
MHRIRTIARGAALACSLATSLSFAQSSGGDKASAEALFNEGVSLVAAGNYDSGCGKFEASQALDPTLGTELRLADCYERAKKTASAWATFKHAQGLAHVQGQTEREELARQRVEALAPQLSYLNVAFEGPRPPGLVVTRNGGAVPLASLGVAIPVDPGAQQLAASAPDHDSWQRTVEVAPGPGTTSVAIAPLGKRPAPVAAPPPKTQPVPLHKAGLGTQRIAGIVTGVVGVAAIFTSGGLGIYAKNRGDRSKQDDYCPTDGHNGCTQAGLDLRDRARAFGTASTVTFIAGAALLTTGIVLYSTAPSESRRSARSRLELRAVGAPQALAASVGGTW